ncbi:hypothetical protein BS78_01G263900 [Paspalum vaginatum]|nr:hypothetical protein BS78_01G263900 [Paspalum vaginatum]
MPLIGSCYNTTTSSPRRTGLEGPSRASLSSNRQREQVFHDYHFFFFMMMSHQGTYIFLYSYIKRGSMLQRDKEILCYNVIKIYSYGAFGGRDVWWEGRS